MLNVEMDFLMEFTLFLVRVLKQATLFTYIDANLYHLDCSRK